MPFDIEALQDEAKELSVAYKGRTACIRYGEDRMSGRDWQDLHLEAPAGTDTYPFNVRFLQRVLVSWDLVAKKEPVPLTAAAIHGLPPRLVAAIAEAVMADLFPNPTTESDTSSFAT